MINKLITLETLCGTEILNYSEFGDVMIEQYRP